MFSESLSQIMFKWYLDAYDFDCPRDKIVPSYATVFRGEV